MPREGWWDHFPPPKAGPCVGGAQGRRGSSGSSGGYERPMISCHFYLEPTQSFSVAIFTQCSHLITPSLSVVSLHLASKFFFFFPKSSEVPRSAAARASAIYKQVLPLAGAKTSITTHLPTVPLKRANQGSISGFRHSPRVRSRVLRWN